MTDNAWQTRLDALQERLHIRFHRQTLLLQALTHRSYLAEDESALANERLEYLGDAVLDLVIAEELFRRYPDWSEGELSKSKSVIVEERSLETVARQWGLGHYMRLSRGEEASGGRERRALLADAMEALFGAYYLDRGLKACRALILQALREFVDTIEQQEHVRDYKTQLQEVFQAQFQAAPRYEVVNESGPPHDKTFEVVVQFNGDILGRGKGKTKKEAEQHAAAEGLRYAAEMYPSSRRENAM